MALIIKKWLYEIFQNRKNEKKDKLLDSSLEKEPTMVVLAVKTEVKKTSHKAYRRPLVVALVAAILFLTCLALSIYYFTRRTNTQMCGVDYMDRYYDPQSVHHMEEEVSGDLQYTRLRVPAFDECTDAVFMHDFLQRYSAIVDIDHRRCFVWPLNSTQILPPKNFYDMIRKVAVGYFIPNLEVVRHDYRIIPRQLGDLARYGSPIESECSSFATYELQRVSYSGFVKRSVDSGGMLHYGELVSDKELSKYRLLAPQNF